MTDAEMIKLLAALKAEIERNPEASNGDYTALIFSIGDVRLFYTLLSEYIVRKRYQDSYGNDRKNSR
jgi:hypothetical protein